jgi:hypothetical protein
MTATQHDTSVKYFQRTVSEPCHHRQVLARRARGAVGLVQHPDPRLTSTQYCRNAGYVGNA